MCARFAPRGGGIVGMNPNEGQPGQGYPGSQGYSGYPGGYPGSQGYPPPPVGTYPQPSTGFSFQDLYQRWRSVLSIGFNPPRGVATFDAQQPAATWQLVWISVTILAVVDAVFSVITSAEFRSGGLVSSFIGGLLGAYIGFFIAAGVLFVIAKLFSGTGSFLTYTFLLSLIYVPLGIISSVAGVIPFLGGLIALAAGIYEIILAIYATMSAHRLTMGKSVAVVLIPVVAAVVIAFLLAVIAGLAILAMGGFGR